MHSSKRKYSMYRAGVRNWALVTGVFLFLWALAQRHSESTELSWKLLWHLTDSDSSLAAERTSTDSTQRMWLGLVRRKFNSVCVQDKKKDNEANRSHAHVDIVDFQAA